MELVRFTDRPEEYLWAQVEPLLRIVCQASKGRFDYEDAVGWIAEGKWQLWAAIDDDNVKAIATTEILNYAKMKVCRVCTGTGKGRADWQDFRLEIENWARERGCKRIEAFTRKGWARIFKDYEMSHVLLEREL